MKKKIGYRERTCKDGSLSIKIMDPVLAQKIKDHCKLTNQSPVYFVSACVERYLKDAYSEYLKSLPKEDLIKMIMERKEA